MEKRIEMYDKILVNDIKNTLEDWLTTTEKLQWVPR